MRTSRSQKDLQDFLNNSKAKLKSPPFLRLIDKFAFMAGIAMLLGTQYFMLAAPQYIHWFYVLVLLPLFIHRFFHYHGIKYHYFLLDFCYYCQFVYFFYFVFFWDNINYFKLLYALTTGPLGFAVVVWRNSLVFHDLDKVTTLFIHIIPPCVSYCLRWHNPSSTLFATPESQTLTFTEVLGYPMLLYTYWQVSYVIRTELLDRRKLSQDRFIVTSKVWMSEIQPHFLYNFFHKRGMPIPPLFLLVGFQYIYTLIFLLPAKLAYDYKWFNTLYVTFIFFCSCWFGACYYFDVFSKKYTQRLKRFLELETMRRTAEQKKDDEPPEDFARAVRKKAKRQGACPKYGSVVEWCFSMTFFTGVYYCFVRYILDI